MLDYLLTPKKGIKINFKTVEVLNIHMELLMLMSNGCFIDVELLVVNADVAFFMSMPGQIESKLNQTKKLQTKSKTSLLDISQDVPRHKEKIRN